ncbi:MAG TPA: acetate kinase [Aliiroseovarius sp.]|nr:acetate kinase [Aliiroseovarius sp.]
MGEGEILVLNAGSSSLKFALFDRDLDGDLREHASGVAEIGAHALPDHGAALASVLKQLAARGVTPARLSAAAHRVVHGGETLRAPVRLTPASLAEIRACIPLAPLHNPHNLAAIDALSAAAPRLAQFASFDTAFHRTMPAVAARYALPNIPETRAIRRYGFHGLSYGALVRAWPGVTGTPLPRRLLAFHLGNGASICAIREGQSIATTMGFSPLDGLTMGTRPGGIGADAVLKLVEENGLPRTRNILLEESGLAGLSGGISDMRALLASPSPKARFAVDHFINWSIRHAGSLIAALGGLDAIAFTGGIGENAAEIRARILAGLDWAGVRAADTSSARLHAPGSRVAAWVIPAQEEKQIAREALGLIGEHDGQ